MHDVPFLRGSLCIATILSFAFAGGGFFSSGEIFGWTLYMFCGMAFLAALRNGASKIIGAGIFAYMIGSYTLFPVWLAACAVYGGMAAGEIAMTFFFKNHAPNVDALYAAIYFYASGIVLAAAVWVARNIGTIPVFSYGDLIAAAAWGLAYTAILFFTLLFAAQYTKYGSLFA